MRFFHKLGWDRVFKEYEEHVRAIRDSLPAGARALSSLSFNNSNVKAVKHLSKRAVEIVIEGRGYDFFEHRWLPRGIYTFSFVGVKKAWVPYSIAGNIWLHEEMHLSDIAAFDYQVSLVRDEIRIQADDVLFTQGVCV